MTHQQMYEARRLPLLPPGVDSNVGFWPVELQATVWPTDEWSALNRQGILHPIEDLAARLLVMPFLL